MNKTRDIKKFSPSRESHTKTNASLFLVVYGVCSFHFFIILKWLSDVVVQVNFKRCTVVTGATTLLQGWKLRLDVLMELYYQLFDVKTFYFPLVALQTCKVLLCCGTTKEVLNFHIQPIIPETLLIKAQRTIKVNVKQLYIRPLHLCIVNPLMIIKKLISCWSCWYGFNLQTKQSPYKPCPLIASVQEYPRQRDQPS